MWIAPQDLPRTVAHPFYARLNQILDEHDFDGYVEGLCQRFYADEVGRPGLHVRRPRQPGAGFHVHCESVTKSRPPRNLVPVTVLDLRAN